MNAKLITEAGVEAPGQNASLGLAEQLVRRLRERIVRWRLPPGHRFTEDELCREFGISRSPVREALKVLTANGFVEQLPRRGYAVRQLDLREIEELYEVRLALEQLVVERLAQRTEPGADLHVLRKEWQALRDDAGEEPSSTLAQRDERFHEGLAQVLGNETLLRHLRTINERLLIFRTIDFESPERIQHTCEQHLAVLERIAAGDGKGARAAIERNIVDGCSIVERAIADALARGYLDRSRAAATSGKG